MHRLNQAFMVKWRASGKSWLDDPQMRNIGTVTLGTTLAQAVSMAFVPIIARLFGPEAWGVLGTVTAIIGIVGPIAAFAYPLAVVLPQKPDHARHLVALSLAIASFVCLSLLTIGLGAVALYPFSLVTISGYALIPLIAVAIWCFALNEAAVQWLIREHRFREIAVVVVLVAIFNNAIRLGAGFVAPSALTLISIYVAGLALMFFANAGAAIRHGALGATHFRLLHLRNAALRYIDFLFYRSPQILLNSISQSIPILTLASFFDIMAAGYFTMAATILAIPVTLVGKAVSDVIYPGLAEKDRSGQQIYPLVRTYTIRLFGLGIVPFGAVIIWGEPLFSLVLGEQWSGAGDYARWISLWLFFAFINRPSLAAIPVIKVQRQFLLIEVVALACKALGFALVIAFGGSSLTAVAVFCTLSVAHNSVLIIWILNLAKGRAN
ncbi:lipopolysaccharide biosynthesis protein [Pelagibacterium lentulum]|uniref:Polysaccharide biosynthesis protein n=1 Tax=Pelagibacterium lentulum TaxID=2029865 RepID=A0A916R475_9HYPH|nr:lipopolysaccharide biosynthesis protein [Pelagibacterium lentulum]GGA36324.1 hypothetical protein GCM10011499_02090 [Pelagibacterium lentulum]